MTDIYSEQAMTPNPNRKPAPPPVQRTQRLIYPDMLKHERMAAQRRDNPHVVANIAPQPNQFTEQGTRDRRAILRVLADRPRGWREVVTATGLTKGGVTNHIRRLRHTGMIEKGAGYKNGAIATYHATEEGLDFLRT